MKTLYESILDLDDDSLDQRTDDIRREDFVKKGYLKTQFHESNTGYDVDFKTMTITIRENMEAYAGYNGRPSFVKMGFKKIDCNGYNIEYICPEDAGIIYNCNVLSVLDRDGRKNIEINIKKKQNIERLKISCPFGGSYAQISGKAELVSKSFDLSLINISCPLSNTRALDKLYTNCEHISVVLSGGYYHGQHDKVLRGYRETNEHGRPKLAYNDIPDEVINRLFPNMPDLIQIDLNRYITLYKKRKGGWTSHKN